MHLAGLDSKLRFLPEGVLGCCLGTSRSKESILEVIRSPRRKKLSRKIIVQVWHKLRSIHYSIRAEHTNVNLKKSKGDLHL